MPHTVRLHRVLRSTPDKIFRAFTDADAIMKWLPPNGFIGHVHSIEARPGGTYAMSFTNFSTGATHHWHGGFTELTPNERIVLWDEFDVPGLDGRMTKTIDIKAVSCGVELTIVHDGLPDVIPHEGCYLGWQESLAALAKLVEPEIP